MPSKARTGGALPWRTHRGLAVVLAALVVLAIVVPAGADASTRETLAINWRLGNAALLIHDGYGHLSKADPSGCVIQATGRYLVDLSTPPPGTVCPSDRLPFDPDFGQPTASGTMG